jgi:glycosyltransferase involved in cell wall biosynthesis
MKTICIDARMLNSAGIGTYLKNILPYITKKYKSTLILRKKDLELFNWTKLSRIIECERSIYTLTEQVFFSNLPYFDLFWSPHFNVPFFSIKSRKRIVTIHDVFHLAFFSKLKFREKIYAKLMYNKAITKSDLIITDSNFSKSEIIKYTNADPRKINVINCGVNLESFQKKKSSKQIFFNSHKLKKPYFLFVGNLKPHKNLNVLLKAHKILKNDYDLVIIGKKKGLINIDSIFLEQKTDKTVHFFDSISDSEIPFFYQHATAFVFPSLYEGFGLPILESMSVGCPVICSNYASLPEIAADSVLYFNPIDYLELINCMKQVIFNHDLRSKLIRKGFERVKNFSWISAVDKHIDIIEELI